jgi:DNA transposition AAA+ family ATPase
VASRQADRNLVERVKPPAGHVVRRRVRDYMAGVGMSDGDLASDIGRIARSSLAHFMSGTYEQVASRDDIIRAKLWDYLERHPITEDDENLPAKLLRTRDTRTVMGLCEEARRKGRVVIIEGPPGTSKTTALKWHWTKRNRLQERDAIYLRCWSGITGVALLRALCRLLGANTALHRDSLLRNAVRKLQRRRPCVLLVDEAQHLLGLGSRTPEAFEQLRDVLDLAGCGCVLAGHFTFLKSLTNGLGSDLEQWLSRIDLHAHLRGLRADEKELDRVAEDYLGERLSGNVREALVKFALARDRNAALRSRLLPKKGERLPTRYLSIRRVRKFFERIEELKALPENSNRPLPALARGALKLLMAPEGRAL